MKPQRTISSGAKAWLSLSLALAQLVMSLFTGAAAFPASPASVAAAAIALQTCDASELIGALESANASAGAEVIELKPACVYVLTTRYGGIFGQSGLPTVTGEVTIDGQGATIGADPPFMSPTFRLLEVAPGALLRLNDVTMVGGSLTDYGGSTPTIALLADSAAIDTGDNAVCAAPLVGGRDQRGFPRHVDANADGVATCDIGSYEAPIKLFLPLQVSGTASGH